MQIQMQITLNPLCCAVPRLRAGGEDGEDGEDGESVSPRRRPLILEAFNEFDEEEGEEEGEPHDEPHDEQHDARRQEEGEGEQ